jgi:uncharacterized protein (DUF433 family)
MTVIKPFNRITVDPNIMDGRPCIRGMRIQVSLILNLVANGMSSEDIIKDYPYIEREDISQCFRKRCHFIRRRQKEPLPPITHN